MGVEAKKKKPRRCRGCGKEMLMTAAELKVHAAECKTAKG